MKAQEAPLDQARQAIQQGRTEAARRLLARVLREDPRNAQAWLLLSKAVVSVEQQRECLTRALALEPANEAAQTELARLLARAAQDTVVRGAGTVVRGSETQPYPIAHPHLFSQRASSALPLSAPMAEPEITVVVAAPASLDETQRQRAYRNLFVAGALMLSLMCGVVLLIITVTSVVPQARRQIQPTPEPILFVATLWCPPCQQAGSQVILWEKVGDGISRGAKVGELEHDTPVSVLSEEWSEPEGRTYYKVAAEGLAGWVPETFLKR